MASQALLDVGHSRVSLSRAIPQLGCATTEGPACLLIQFLSAAVPKPWVVVGPLVRLASTAWSLSTTSQAYILPPSPGCHQGVLLSHDRATAQTANSPAGFLSLGLKSSPCASDGIQAASL
ncbi:uncharacterized protein UV8b_06543 [Ustilaginoidea virens]|uniref:Uncharacterized protein n=1 Tax=Ustilaginoidea virens TaxID=1159556 RepID=A0A8E5HVN4_USTVR|nr:uncharacterized protein UV8b_06543 [Ustilaginoidea virens]QUC22302.1 hypothetical protein UV8b_06543 [Ustilaginoidea virens]